MVREAALEPAQALCLLGSKENLYGQVLWTERNPWAVGSRGPRAQSRCNTGEAINPGGCRPSLEKGFTLAKPALHSFRISFLLPLPDGWNLNLVQSSSERRDCLLNQPWLLPRCYCWYVLHAL